MASSDLESYFNTIRTAKSGEVVRDAIINAAKSMKTASTNAGSLNGVDAKNFAKSDDFLRLRQDIYDKLSYDELSDLEDDEHALISQNVMTSGNLYAYMQQYLRPALKKIMHYENDPLENIETKEAVIQYLTLLETAKLSMFEAISAKSKPDENPALFRDFAQLINDITDDIPVLIDNVKISKDGTYDANKGVTYQRAYESIDVDVKDLTVTGSFSDNNSVHYPPAGKLFSQVTVNVNTRSSVRASGGRGRTTGSGDGEITEGGLLKTLMATENITYNAFNDGYEGYETISVHVTEPEVSGTFTVTFLNGQDTLGEPVTVAAYETAYYEGETPVSQEDPNKEFVGWAPTPYRVTSNMDCYAVFRDPIPGTSGEISDSWEEIIANRGTNYQIGEYKSLSLGTVNNRNYGTLIFEKVLNGGEGGANSSWVSRTVVPMSLIGSLDRWPTCSARTFLNGEFMDYLSTNTDGELLANAVLPIKKYTLTRWIDWEGAEATRRAEMQGELETIDQFWVPSFQEMFGGKEERLNLIKQGQHNHFQNRKAAESPNKEHVTTLMLQNYLGSPGKPWFLGVHEIVPNFTYAGAYGGVTYTLNQDNEVQHATNTPAKYIKYNCQNTSTAVGWVTRTLNGYGFVSLESPYIANYNYGCNAQGQVGSGDYYPIGFCL